MPEIEVLGFFFDDENEEKFWNLGLTARQELTVLSQAFVVKRNCRQRRAPYLVIGVDSQGQCLAIPIEPTLEPGIWRPITAWPCKPSEWAQLPKERSR